MPDIPQPFDWNALTPATLRKTLPDWLGAFFADPAVGAINAQHVAAWAEAESDEALEAFLAALRTAGVAEHERLADPAGRRLTRAWSQDTHTEALVSGLEHLDEAIARGPVLMLCNHLSYIDTTATDHLLNHAGRPDLADRIVAVAGPKVFGTSFRSLAATCLSVLPSPQSAAVDDTLSPRERVRRALQAIQRAHALLDDGKVVLLYAEGTRSRTRRLQPFLRATRRYAEHEGLHIAPAAVTGTQQLMPVGDDQVYPTRLSLTFGPPIAVHGDGEAALAAGWQAVAALLPEDMQPSADTEPLR